MNQSSEKQDITLEDLAAAKKLPVEFLKSQGLKPARYMGNDAIEMTFIAFSRYSLVALDRDVAVYEHRLRRQRALINNDGEAASTRYGHIQSIFIEQKLKAARDILSTRRTHREDHNFCLLSLKFIDGSNSSAVPKHALQKVHLHVVWRDHQDVVQCHFVPFHVSIYEAVS